MYLLNIRAHVEWNVATHIDSAPYPTMSLILSRISPAALFVKVIASILNGLIPFSFIIYAVRLVITRVLPEPAPAKMRSGPSI